MPLNSPIITGDVSGGLHSTSVDKLKGNAVAATAPTSGQTLAWNGTAWTPATPTNATTTGTGLWKNVSGTLNGAASLLVDADVDAAAAIAQSKIDGLTAALANVSAPGTQFEFLEHFLGSTPLAGNMTLSTGGGGTSAVSIAGTGFGILAMSTGITAVANRYTNLSQTSLYSLIGNSSARVIWRVSQGSASWFDATLTGSFRCGWGNSIVTESVNAIYFRSENRQQIDFVTKTGGTEAVTNTGVSFAQNTFRNLEIVINAAGTEVVAKIDGAIVATHTTHIPTAAIYFQILLNRAAAIATSVVANVEFVYFKVTPNTPYFV